MKALLRRRKTEELIFKFEVEHFRTEGLSMENLRPEKIHRYFMELNQRILVLEENIFPLDNQARA